MAYVGTPRALGSNQATLASIIYGEAGNQGTVGMQAVGAVITNRANVNLNGYGADVMSQALAPNQFQGQSANYSPQAYAIAGNVLNGTNPDPTGGALYYANPGASSASWARNLNSSNSLQIGDHYFTDNTQGVPFQPNFSGSGVASNGVPDNSQGGTPASGDPNPLGTLSVDPSGTGNYGDITGYSVAGVNAPLDTGSTASAGAPSVLGGAGTGVGTSGFSGGGSTAAAGDAGQGMPLSEGLQQGTIAAVSGWITQVQNAVGGAFTSALTAAQTAVGTWFGAIQNWFVRGFLIILGIVVLAGALLMLAWDHGGKETAQRVMAVA